jgi:ribosomal-protein-alanine N-acetyltransferase
MFFPPKSLCCPAERQKRIQHFGDLLTHQFRMPLQAETSIGTELSLNIFARYFVAELEGEIVGFGGMWVVVDEAHITNIAVLEKHRRQGIGRAILHTLLSTAKEERCRAATLEVRVGNIQARRLYESFGFAPVGIRPKYYSDTNEDALIMWCVLE